MRSDPAKFDAAEWEFIQAVVVPNRKPLPEHALPIDEDVRLAEEGMSLALETWPEWGEGR